MALIEIPRNCFQCGAPTEFVIDPDSEFHQPGWLTCPRCGEKIVSIEELRRTAEGSQEERVKRNLGFYDFKPKRGA